MSLLERRRKRPELNLVPLIDVLVMLIFFAFVTMQFKSAATLNITLPKVETAGKNEFKGNITIGLDKSGNLSFNGHAIRHDELPGLLRQVRSLDTKIPVLIKADEDVPLKDVTFVWDECRKLGLNNQNLQSR